MKKSMMVIFGLLAMASTSLNAIDLKSVARRVADNNKTSRLDQSEMTQDREKEEAAQTLQTATQKVLSALGWKDSSPEFADSAVSTPKVAPKSEELFAPKPSVAQAPEPEEEVINVSSLFNRDEEDEGESRSQAATVTASRIPEEAPKADFVTPSVSRPTLADDIKIEGPMADLPAAPISQETAPVSSDEITRSLAKAEAAGVDLAEVAASAPTASIESPVTLAEPAAIVGPGPDLPVAPSEVPPTASSDEITRSLAKAEAAGVDLAEVAASAPPISIDGTAALAKPAAIVGPGPDLPVASLSEAPATASNDEITRSLAKAEAAGVDLAEVAASAPATTTERLVTPASAEPNLVPQLPAHNQPLIMVMEDKLGPSPSPKCRKKCAWDCNVMDPVELKNYITENYNELVKLGWIKTPLEFVEVINSDLENLNLSNNTRAVLQYMLQFILHGNVFPIEEDRLATPEEREKLLNAAKLSVEFDNMTVAEGSRGIIKDTPHSQVIAEATKVFDLKNPMAQEHELDEATKVGLTREEMIKVGNPSKGSALSHVLSAKAPKIPFSDKREFDHPYSLPLVTQETGIGNSIEALMRYIGIEVGS
jgi:hypothetical protein